MSNVLRRVVIHWSFKMFLICITSLNYWVMLNKVLNFSMPTFLKKKERERENNEHRENKNFFPVFIAGRN